MASVHCICIHHDVHILDCHIREDHHSNSIEAVVVHRLQVVVHSKLVVVPDIQQPVAVDSGIHHKESCLQWTEPALQYSMRN